MAETFSPGKVKQKVVVFAAHPVGMVKESDMRVEEQEIDLAVKEGSGDVVLKVMVISLDPYYRELMHEEDKDTPFGIPMFKIGQPLCGGLVGKVVLSANPEFSVGDFVLGYGNFAEYIICPNAQGCRKVDSSVPLSYYVGVCGMPGMTAWAGLKLLGKPKEGEQVYVTAAAGAVGQIVGQLAKAYGCRVVGSVGSDEKVELLKTEFGFDDAFNYKTEKDWNAALTKYFPNGIDIYFDNVGGRMLNEVLMHINKHARIPLCGMASQYNVDKSEWHGLQNVFNLIGNCAHMYGFMVGQFESHAGEFFKEVSGLVKEGKIKAKEDVTEGIENLPAAFVGLMKGTNVGKAVVRVSN